MSKKGKKFFLAAPGAALLGAAAGLVADRSPAQPQAVALGAFR